MKVKEQAMEFGCFNPLGRGLPAVEERFMDVDGYQSLADVLQRAYDQAARGKGKERHACDRAFTAQPMQTISELLGSHIGLQYQAIKKIQESNRLDKDAQIREMLGAINYIAGAIIFLEER